ncbi:MAG: ribosome silencing factor [bacterium]
MSEQTDPTTYPAPRPAPATRDTPDAEVLPIEIARLLGDLKCTDIVILDVRKLSEVQDFLVLATGTSERQIRAVAHQVKHLVEQRAQSVYRTSSDDQATWVVIDCVDLVVHLFEPNARGYYDLEAMWADAPQLPWQRSTNAPRPGLVTTPSEPQPTQAEQSPAPKPKPKKAPTKKAPASTPVKKKSTKKAPAKPRKKVAKAKPVAKPAKKKVATKARTGLRVKARAKPKVKPRKPSAKRGVASKRR